MARATRNAPSVNSTARTVEVAPLDEELRVERTDAVHVRVAAQHLGHRPHGAFEVAVVGADDGLERLDERVVGLHLRAQLKLGRGVVVAVLVEEDARAVVADDDALGRVDLEHAAVGVERVLVAAVEACDGRGGELRADVVGRLALELRGQRARARLVATRQLDKDHVEPRLEQTGLEASARSNASAARS